jgi:predicted amidohydrolase
MPPNTAAIAAELSLGVYQFAPRLRDVADNIARIGRTARQAAVDLLITPELSLTGYDLRDDVHAIAQPLAIGNRADRIWTSNAHGLSDQCVVVGAVERSDTTVPYNSAVLIERGTITHLQRKVYLPTYGMFDEGRYFGHGDRMVPFVIKGWRFGMLICEDFWHPMLAYLHAVQGVHALLVMAAAPGRGAWDGGEENAFFASSDSWERIARAYAQLYGVYVIVCNRCGVEGGVTFAGESLIVGPDSSVIARAGIDEELLRVELTLAAIQAARTPYAHVRDEDALLAIRELQRITRPS